MSATLLTKASRYFRPGTSQINILPAVAATTLIPTRIEINAGKRVDADVSDVTGFTVTGSKIDTPDWGSLVVKNVPGRVTYDDSSISWYADSSGVDIRSLVALGSVVYVCFLDAGDVSALFQDVFKCRVLSVSSDKSSTDAAKIMVGFAVLDVALQVAIPT